MRIYPALERIGLTNNEIKVYLTLLDTGLSPAGDIAKNADMHRRPVYDALNRLVEKGLVSYTIKSGKKYFQAANPKRLITILKEREDELREILPDLNARFKSKKPKVFAEVFDGKEGAKTVLEDVLREKKEWLSIGATGKGLILFPLYMKFLSRKRVKEGIKRKILLANTPLGKRFYNTLKKQPLLEAKFLPKDFKNPQTTWIYGDRVVIIHAYEDHPVLFMIQNKDIANSFRDYFRVLWKQV